MKEKTLIIIAHGSKNKKWTKHFQYFYSSLKSNYKNRVFLSYLGNSKPSLTEVLKRATKVGNKHLQILPFFISKGNHIEKDIPNIIQDFKKNNHKIKIKILPIIGEHKQVLKLYKEIVINHFKS